MSRTWHQGVDRLIAAVSGLVCLSVLGVWASHWLFDASSDLPLRLGVCVLMLAVAARGVLGWLSATDWLLTYLAMHLSLVLLHRLGVTGHGADAIPPSLLLGLSCMVAALTARSVAWVVLGFAAAGVPYLAARYWIDPASLWGAFDEVVITFTGCGMLALLVWRMRATAASADTAQASAMAARQAAAEEGAREGALEDARRLLHDEVIAALAVVQRAHLMAGRSRHREVSRRALAAIEQRGTEVAHASLDDSAVASWERELGLEIEVIRHSHFELETVPPVAALAVVEATREALRNVALHSLTHAAELILGGDAKEGPRIEIVDQGVGFSADSPEGFGLKESLKARVNQVGGRVDVASNPGQGTRVVIWLPPAAERVEPTPLLGDAPHRLLRLGPGHLERFVMTAAMLGGSGSIWLALRYPAPGEDRVAGVVLAGAVVVMYAALARRCARGVLSAGEHVLVTLALAEALVVGLGLAGPYSLRGFGSWVVGFVGLHLVVTSFAAPFARTMALAAPLSLIVWLAAVVDPTLAPDDVLYPICLPFLYAAFGGAGAAALRRLDREVAWATNEAMRTMVRRSVVEARVQALRAQLSHLLEPVADLLSDIIESRKDTEDPETIAEAMLLAHEARDDLYLLGAITPAHRARLRSLRGCGASVTIRAAAPPTANGERVNALLSEALELARQGLVLTVSLETRPDSHDRISLTGPLDEVDHAGLFRVADALGGDLVVRERGAVLTIIPGSLPALTGAAAPLVGTHAGRTDGAS